MACDDRQLTEAQRQAGFQNQRTGVQRAVRPFQGAATVDNLVDYINRELYPAVRSSRDAVNDVYLQVTDNAPSANPLGYYFSDITANADPTAGRLRLDAATQDTATTIRVSESNGRLNDAAPWLDVMAGGATSPLGVVTLTDAINPGRFIRFDLTAMTDQGAYWDLAVTPVESSHDNPFVDGGAVVVSFISGVSATGSTVPIGSLSPIAADTFVGNFTAGPAAPQARAGASVAGAGLTYTTGGTLAVGSSTSIAVNANDVQRAALTGFAEAAVNSNATTSAEPIVTFTTSANMSNERVLTAGTNTTVDTSVAGQVRINATDTNTTYTAGDATITLTGTAFTRPAIGGDIAIAVGSNTAAINPGVIVDADVNAAAAIAQTKTGALTGAITKASGSAATLFDASASGAGLTGGGTAVLAVGAGAGITVGANDVAVTAGRHIVTDDGTSFRKSESYHYWYDDFDTCDNVSFGTEEEQVFTSHSRWYCVSSNGIGSTSEVTTEDGRPGIMRLTSPALANASVCIAKAHVELGIEQTHVRGEQVYSMKWHVRLSAATNVALFIGLFDVLNGGAISNAIGFDYVSTTGLTRGYLEEAGAVTNPAITFTMDASFHEYEVRQETLGTITFHIDGVQVASSSSNVPDAERLNAGVLFFPTAAAARSVDIDYAEFESRLLTRP